MTRLAGPGGGDTATQVGGSLGPEGRGIVLWAADKEARAELREVGPWRGWRLAPSVCFSSGWKCIGWSSLTGSWPRGAL